MRNEGLPGSLVSVSAPSTLVRPLMRTTETKRFGMSAAVIGTETVCCVEVSAKVECERMPSRSTVSRAVAPSHGDWIISRAVHLHAGDRRAIEGGRHHPSAQPVLLIYEHGRPLQPDVPGRRMHDEACVAGDVLARDVLDVAFECVAIRHAVAGPRLEIERE